MVLGPVRHCLPSVVVIVLLGADLLISGFLVPAEAVVTPPLTSSGLNTQVSVPTPVTGGQTQYNITGGSRPDSGPNLFHSFGKFDVPKNNIANFLNDTNIPTTNILSRVTGGNPSNIFGTIQTTGFPAAHLFLMNPAGVVFGPTAQLNVEGSFHVTTADYLRLTDGVPFTAVPGAQDALLTSASVAAFGFLGPKPAPITIQQSSVSVPAGQTLSLVAGNIAITGDQVNPGTGLNAPSGRINIASVASAGEVIPNTLGQAADVNVESFSHLGNIDVSRGASIRTQSNPIGVNPAGTIIIRGGQISLQKPTLTDVLGAAGNPGGFISIRGDQLLLNGGAISASTQGSVDHPGTAIDIQVTAEVLLTAAVGASEISSSSFGTGNAGDIKIVAGSVELVGNAPAGLGSSIGSRAFGISNDAGHGGTIDIITDSLTLRDNASIQTSSFGAGTGGNVIVTAKESISIAGPTGGIFISSSDRGDAGTITLSTLALLIDGGLILAQTLGAGHAGDISINAGSMRLAEGALISSTTFGDGRAGNIIVSATEIISIGGQRKDPLVFGSITIQNSPSGIINDTFAGGKAGNISLSTPILQLDGGLVDADSFGSGNAGNIMVEVGSLSLVGGALISGTALAGGAAGNVNVSATGSILISGQRAGVVTIGDLVLVNTQSGIASATLSTGNGGTVRVSTNSLMMSNRGLIAASTGGAGAAGDVLLDVRNLTLLSGAQVTSSSGIPVGDTFLLGNGQGGFVTIKATDSMTISGQNTGIFTNSAGNGSGGNISLTASQINLTDGASISAKSLGTGSAGNITITAIDSLVGDNSSVTTEALQSDGGDIHINAGRLIHLTNSDVTSTVGSVDVRTTVGGNIFIDPEFVILDNSRILANAFAGTGGNINIVAGVLLVDPLSIIDASSALGVSGTVTIQSPISSLSETLAPLPQAFLRTGALLSSRCVARLGGPASSFVVAGRDAIPMEPGGLLPSPLYSFEAVSASTNSDERPSTPNVHLGADGLVALNLIALDAAADCAP